MDSTIPEGNADKAIVRNETANEDYALPYGDIVRIAEALERGEPVDVTAEMKRFMDAE